MNKKWLVGFMLSFAVLLVIAGCGGGSTGKQEQGSKTDSGAETTQNPEGNGQDDKQYSIAISQYVEHPSLDATREGFLAALADAGLVKDQNLKVDLQVAQADSANNLTIAEKLANEKQDLVLGIATPSAIALAGKITDRPVLFAAVTDPLQERIVTDMEKPGANITGGSDTNKDAIVKLMDFIAEHFSAVKTVGIVINKGEGNAVVMADVAREALKKHNIEVVEAAVATSADVKQAAESLIGRADAIYITLDNSVVSGVQSIIQVANDHDIPFFSSDRDTVEAGAFATVGFKYFDHGYQVGQTAVEILKNGKNPGDIAVTVPEKTDLIINLKAAAEQGITVTDAMKNAVVDQETNLLQ